MCCSDFSRLLWCARLPASYTLWWLRIRAGRSWAPTELLLLPHLPPPPAFFLPSPPSAGLPADRVRVYYKAAATGRIQLQSADPAFLSPLATILSDVDGDSRKVRQFQLSLLEAIEYQVGTQTPALLPVTPVVIKNLYDHDIIDEDTILTWYDMPTQMHSNAARVRARAEPIAVWLRKDEEGEGEGKPAGEAGEAGEGVDVDEDCSSSDDRDDDDAAGDA